MSKLVQANELRWVACPECDASCQDHPLPPKSFLRCIRCGSLVKKAGDSISLQRAWALATTGLFFAVLANTYPILTFSVAGNTQSNLVITGVFGLVNQGYWPISLLVFVAGIAGPMLHLASLSYVLAGCCFRFRLPAIRRVLSFAESMEAWNLAPVYFVATVVAVVKLDMLGNVDWQQGALWILALSLCSLLTVQFFNRDLVERRLEELE